MCKISEYIEEIDNIAIKINKNQVLTSEEVKMLIQCGYFIEAEVFMIDIESGVKCTIIENNNGYFAITWGEGNYPAQRAFEVIKQYITDKTFVWKEI